MPWTDVTVGRSDYIFPNRCPQCLRYGPDKILGISSDTEKLKGYYVVALKYQRLRVNVPFCTECAAKRVRYSRYGQWLIFTGLAVGVTVAIWLDLGRGQTFVAGVLFAAPGVWLMHFYGQDVKVADYSDQTVTFSFKHLEYAQEFMQLNPSATIAKTAKAT